MAVEDQASQKNKKEEPGFFSFENLKSLAIIGVVIFAFRWTVVSPYVVPTASMEPTIKVGDRVIANKLAYDLRVPFTDISLAKLGEIKRGDIIVFRYPKDPSWDYVKRVVGLPGDKIRLVDDVLYVNDEPQPRVDAQDKRAVLDDIKDQKELKSVYRETLGGVEHWVINTVPEARHFTRGTWPSEDTFHTVAGNSVFVMGDNRDNSKDSRSWGEVPMENIRGKAILILWSMYQEDDSYMPIFRWYRFFRFLDSL